MDENPDESHEEPLLELEAEPERPQIALRIKRIMQAIALCCAVVYFLLNAGVLPPQKPLVNEMLFGGAMIGLLLILVCNFFIRSKKRPAITARRLKLK